jgi:hypothetical protein
MRESCELGENEGERRRERGSEGHDLDPAAQAGDALALGRVEDRLGSFVGFALTARCVVASDTEKAFHQSDGRYVERDEEHGSPAGSDAKLGQDHGDDEGERENDEAESSGAGAATTDYVTFGLGPGVHWPKC